MTPTDRVSGDPRELLLDLRWTADRIITNYDGERVWLKQIEHGLTDCCAVDNPCDYHGKLTHAAPPGRQ
jgi:hypothetical protein